MVKDAAIHLRTTVLAAAVAITAFVPARAQVVIDPIYPISGYWIHPNPATAGAQFTLQVGGNFACATSFSHQAVAVTPGRLDLTFVAHYDFGPVPLDQAVGIPAPCVYDMAQPVQATADRTLLPIGGIGPTFTVPALKAGKYQVWLHKMFPCHVTPPYCKAAVMDDSAGILEVVDARVGWFIQPDEVKAKQDFVLKVLNEKYGSCHTSFSHVTARVRDGRINVSFLATEVQTDIQCFVDIRPYGPSIPLQGIQNAGDLPVYVTELLPCEVTPPLCAVDRVLPMRPDDTLHVLGVTSLRPNANAQGGARVSLRGGRLEISAPPGQGPWKAELLTAAGRWLRTVAIPAGSGRESVTLSLPSTTLAERGVYLVRLIDARGKATALPVAAME